VMNRAAKMIVLAAGIGVLVSAAANAAGIGQVVSVDLANSINSAPDPDSGGSMNPGDTAGLVPRANWTTVTSGAASNLQDSAGAATSLDITGISPGNSGGYPNDGFTVSPDLKMMGDGFYSNGGDLTLSLAQIPYPEYNLYVYVGTDVNINRGGPVQTTNSPITFYYKGSNTVNSYILATETDSFAEALPSNYILFENLTGDSLTITTTAMGPDPGSYQTFICGFQVVELIPEPASAALLGLGLAALLRRRR